SPELDAEADEDKAAALIEGFIDGWEFALEGVMHHGSLNAIALFDKPDPLDGPRFEDSICVTPSLAPEAMQWDILDAVSRAAAAKKDGSRFTYATGGSSEEVEQTLREQAG